MHKTSDRREITGLLRDSEQYMCEHTQFVRRAVGINAWKSEKRTQAERMCDEGCMRLRGVIEN